MTTRMIQLILVGYAWHATSVWGQIQLPAAGDKPVVSTPVTIKSTGIITSRRNHHEILVELAMAPAVQIYGGQEHPTVLPLRVVLLDTDHKVLRTELKLPKPASIKLDEELGGDYSVYRGRVELKAIATGDAIPAFVQVSYHGYSDDGY